MNLYVYKAEYLDEENSLSTARWARETLGRIQAQHLK